MRSKQSKECYNSSTTSPSSRSYAASEISEHGAESPSPPDRTAIIERLQVLAMNDGPACLVYKGGCISYDMRNKIANIVVHESVKKIDDYAFYGCRSLNAVHFPVGSRLKRIGRWAFAECESLKTLHLPSGLEEVGRGALNDCPRLIIVTIPPAVVLKDNVIHNCFALRKEPADDAHGDTFYINHLKTRFNDLPLHEACYNANEQDIKSSLTAQAARETDHFNLTPLHILASNPYATKEMIKLVADQYRDAIVKADNAMGMTPLHFASINVGEHVADFLPYLTEDMASETEKLSCAIKDADSRTPTDLAILYNSSKDARAYLYKCCPSDASVWREEEHKEQLAELEEWYVNHIFHTMSYNNSLSAAEQHGWVHFVSGAATQSSIKKICDFLFDVDKCPKSFVQKLADAKDVEDRKAIDVAVADVKSVLLDRLFSVDGELEVAKVDVPKFVETDGRI